MVPRGGSLRWPSVAAVALVFGQTLCFGFVNYDDNDGVYENPRVTGRLTAAAVVGAFTDRHVESWAPLTCVSHMLVWHVFGANAWGHHLVNVLLHAASTVLLFLVLLANDRPYVAGRGGGRPLCGSSPARRIRGLGHRAEGRLERVVLRAGAGGIRRLCAGAASRSAGQTPAPRGHVPGDVGFLRLGAGRQADGDHAAVRAVVAGLLAARAAGRRAAPAGAGPLCRRRATWSWRNSPCLRWWSFPVGSRCGVNARPWRPNDLVAWPWRLENAAVSYVAYLGQFLYPAGLAVFYPRRATAPCPGRRLRASWRWWASRPPRCLRGAGIRTCWSAGCGTWGCWRR